MLATMNVWGLCVSKRFVCAVYTPFAMSLDDPESQADVEQLAC